jgi:hypothetical protein
MWEINEISCWFKGASAAGRGGGEPLFLAHKLCDLEPLKLAGQTAMLPQTIGLAVWFHEKL